MKFLLLLCCLLAVFTQCTAQSLPIEAFGKLPLASQVQLSPDGNKFAFIQIHNGESILRVKDLTKQKTTNVLSTDSIKFKLSWFVWANNETLLVSSVYPVKRGTLAYKETRLLNVAADGSTAPISLFIAKNDKHIPQFQNIIVDLLPDDPEHVLMAYDIHVPNSPGVYKVNLKNRQKRKLLIRHKYAIHAWMTDQQHRLRIGFGRADTHIFYNLFDLKTQKWRKIWEYEIFEQADITPLGFGKDENELYIRAEHQGRYAIFTVDVSKQELPRTLVYADPKYDIEGSLIYSSKLNDVVGVYHGEANNSKVFWNEDFQLFNDAINTALPKAYNNVSSYSANEQKYILYTSNDKSPGEYYLGSRHNGSLEYLIDEYPSLYQKQLSGKSKITYQARDNLTIEAYVTLPHENSVKTNSAIILPHGGPMARTYGGFDWFVEFLASLGYTVLQPNFRGSSGYGFQFEKASIQNWGKAMQTDLEDGAKWLEDNYKISSNKQCVVGFSYGGYAALMSAINDQNSACAISISGVSDIKKLVKKSRRFTNYEVVKKQLGSDTDLLEKYSPISHVKNINTPILLIHGNKDRVVDVTHSRVMFNELKKHNKPVSYIELNNGNHYFEIEKNRLQMLHSVREFLQKHLPK